MDNRNDDQHRVKRYRFNHKRYEESKNNQDFKTWPWIVGLIVIAIIIVGGIKLMNRSRVNTNRYSQSRKTGSNYKRTWDNNLKNSQEENSNNHMVNKSNHFSKSFNHNDIKNYHSPKINQSNGSSTAPVREQNDISNQIFSIPHTFDSVQDALNWAKATQNEWLKDDYTNFKITSDGQNDYVLQFTR